jgi:hypothetical protein
MTTRELAMPRGTSSVPTRFYPLLRAISPEQIRQQIAIRFWAR